MIAEEVNANLILASTMRPTRLVKKIVIQYPGFWYISEREMSIFSITR